MSAPRELGLLIDHVAFATPDLGAALIRLASLGLSHTPTSECRWPTAAGPERARSLSVMLDDGYLDVIELDPPPGKPALPSQPAPLQATGVVLRSDDLAADRERLMDAGVRCGRAYAIHRSFAGDDPDQHYEIFGIDALHGCGLPQSVIHTRPAARMRNQATHRAGLCELRAAAELLGVRLR